MDIIETPAFQLKPGKAFTLFDKLCTTVFIDVNDTDQTVVRFVMDSDEPQTDLNVLIVPPDTMFPIHQR